MSPEIGLSCCRSCCQPCFPSTRFSLNCRTTTYIKAATHREDSMHLWNGKTCVGSFGEVLIRAKLREHTDFPISRIEPIEWLAFLNHSACQCCQPWLEKREDF